MGRERRQISRATYRTESRPAKAPGPACGTCRSRPLPRRNMNRTSSAPTAPVKAPNTAPAPAETTSPSRDMNHQAAKRMVATRTTCPPTGTGPWGSCFDVPENIPGWPTSAAPPAGRRRRPGSAGQPLPVPHPPGDPGGPGKQEKKKRKPVKVSVTDETMKTRRAPASSPSASRSDTNLEMARGKPAVARISSVLYRGYMLNTNIPSLPVMF